MSNTTFRPQPNTGSDSRRRPAASAVLPMFSKLFVTMSTLLVGGSTNEARRNLIYAVMTKLAKQTDLKTVFGMGPPGAAVLPELSK